MGHEPMHGAVQTTVMLPSTSAKRKLGEDASNPLTNGGKRSKKDHFKPSSKRKLPNAEEQPGGLRIVREPSRPAQTAGAGPSKQPPAKKVRADEPVLPQDHLEADIRAMEDETDYLRRQSRTTQPSRLQFPKLDPSKSTPRRPQAASKSKDLSVLLPQHDSPQITKNKLMRADAMARISSDIEIPISSPVSKSGSSNAHRRRNSIGRGKRISNSFQTMGIISQPHKSVAETSFYKHIDSDLPEISRMKQLLIWSTFRNASSIPPPLPLKPKSKAKAKHPPGLPPLSTEETDLIKSVIDDVMLMLAEGKVNTAPFGSGHDSDVALKPNVQNERNRAREQTFGSDIQQAQQEETAWKEVENLYGTYVKNVDADIVKRAGKRRVTDEEALGSLASTDSAQRAQDILSSKVHRPSAQRSLHPDQRIIVSPRQRARADKETLLQQMEDDVEWKLDALHSYTSTALETTNTSESLLDDRFAALSLGLNTRNRAGQTEISGSVLGTYLPIRNNSANPLEVIRALTRVDRERPPARIGDSARRATREVHRLEERGFTTLGERRLTGVTLTPRKIPTTPRRGNTPARDRRDA